MIDVIIHHDADPDGIWCGAIARKANPEAVLLGYNYEPDFDKFFDVCKGKNVAMLDVSPKDIDDLFVLCSKAENVVWIDHHETAKTSFEGRIAQGNTIGNNLKIVYEGGKWGAARATWKHFFPGEPIPASVRYVADYDVFRSRHTVPKYWDINIYPFRLVSNLMTVEDVLAQFLSETYDVSHQHLSDGQAISRYLTKQNTFVVNEPSLCWKSMFWCPNTTQFVVAVTNGHFAPDMFRDYGDPNGVDFFVAYKNTANGWAVQLRKSNDKSPNLALIAKQFGGGGHSFSAGFGIKTFKGLSKIITNLER